MMQHIKNGCKQGLKTQVMDHATRSCAFPLLMSYCCHRSIEVLMAASESNLHLIFITSPPALKTE